MFAYDPRVNQMNAQQVSTNAAPFMANAMQGAQAITGLGQSVNQSASESANFEFKVLAEKDRQNLAEYQVKSEETARTEELLFRKKDALDKAKALKTHNKRAYKLEKKKVDDQIEANKLRQKTVEEERKFREQESIANKDYRTKMLDLRIEESTGKLVDKSVSKVQRGGGIDVIVDTGLKALDTGFFDFGLDDTSKTSLKSDLTKKLYSDKDEMQKFRMVSDNPTALKAYIESYMLKHGSLNKAKWYDPFSPDIWTPNKK